jgi:hypothetical protein
VTAREHPRTFGALAGAALLAVRLAIVAATADVDTDAYGHFAIARALLHDPTNLAAHWVWQPGYHYLVWALLHLGIGLTGVRAISAVLQAAGPFVLFDGAARREDRDPRAALLAALLWTVAPISNRLATSAQAETCFTLLVVSAAWALDRRRPWLAGTILAAACLVRYEAWGVLPALAVQRARRGREGPGLAAILIPAAAIAGWILLRRHADGAWLVFLGETARFASGVRAAQGFSPLVDGLLVPLSLPFLVLGPAALLVPIGIRRALTPGWAVPAGILAFLVASHLGRGALGLERYLTALVPFACLAIAEGALRLPELVPRIAPRKAAGAALAALGLTTAAHLGWLVHRARDREAQLRGYEADVERR